MASMLQQSFAYDSYFSSCQSYRSESRLRPTNVGDPMSSSPWSLGSTVSRLLCIILYNFLTFASKSPSSSYGAPSLGSRGLITFFPYPFSLILSFSNEILAFIFLAHGRPTRVG